MKPAPSKVNPKIIIAASIVIIGISVYVNQLNYKVFWPGKMALFIVAGGLMFLYGAARYLLEKPKKEHHAHHAVHGREYHARHAHPSKQTHTKHPAHSAYHSGVARVAPNFCHGCGARLNARARFCHDCGRRVH